MIILDLRSWTKNPTPSAVKNLHPKPSDSLRLSNPVQHKQSSCDIFFLGNWRIIWSRMFAFQTTFGAGASDAWYYATLQQPFLAATGSQPADIYFQGGKMIATCCFTKFWRFGNAFENFGGQFPGLHPSGCGPVLQSSVFL